MIKPDEAPGVQPARGAPHAEAVVHQQLDALARGNLDLGRLEAMVLDHEQDIRLGGMGSSPGGCAPTPADEAGAATSDDDDTPVDLETTALLALGIGAYEPRWFMHPQHMNPDEAVKAHRMLESRASLAIHHGTIQLTDEAIDAPELALVEARKTAGLTAEQFVLQLYLLLLYWHTRILHLLRV